MAAPLYAQSVLINLYKQYVHTFFVLAVGAPSEFKAAYILVIMYASAIQQPSITASCSLGGTILTVALNYFSCSYGMALYQ